jgi:hypothetical protein
MPKNVSETLYMSTKWYGVTFQMTVVFVVIAVRISYLTKLITVYVTSTQVLFPSTSLNVHHIENCYSFRLQININFVVFFLMGDSPAAEFYMPTFRNTLSSNFIGGAYTTYEDGRWNVGT